jgi:hypothetical protein
MVMVPTRDGVVMDHSRLAFGHWPATQYVDEGWGRRGIEELGQTRSGGERRGCVAALQDIEGRVKVVRCCAVSHGSSPA